MWGEIERARIIQPAEEKAQEDPINVYKYLLSGGGKKAEKQTPLSGNQLKNNRHKWQEQVLQIFVWSGFRLAESGFKYVQERRLYSQHFTNLPVKNIFFQFSLCPWRQPAPSTLVETAHQVS